MEGVDRGASNIEIRSDEAGFGVKMVSEDESALARAATQHFTDESYQECLELLEQLRAKRPEDPRVSANLAVCKYYVDNHYTRTDKVVKAVVSIYRRIIESNGGDVDSDIQAENCVLMYNVCLAIMDELQLGNAEKLAANLYKLLTLTNNAKSNLQVHSDLVFVKEQLVPLLISLTLLGKNPSSALHFLTEAELKAKQDQDEAGSQRLQLCRALAMVQMKSYKAFKRDLKSNGMSTMNQITFEFMRANMEFIKGNVRKAIKVLAMAMQQVKAAKMEECNEAYLDSLYWNNLCGIHLMMKKPNLAGHYARMSRDCHAKAIKAMDKNQPHFLLKIKMDEIAYNQGIALLHIGKPRLAFDIFVTVIKGQVSFNPSYWLRLAECCVNEHRNHEQIVSELYSRPEWSSDKDIELKVYESVELNRNLRLMVGDNHSHFTPSVSLECAVICLNIAEGLLSRTCDDNSSPISAPGTPPAGDTKSSTSSSNPSSGSASPSKSGPSSSRSRLILLSIWANMAYIKLCQREYSLALEYGEKILQKSDQLTPSGFKCLAHLYSAEALVFLGRPSEALAMLDLKKNSESLMNFSDIGETPTNQNPEQLSRSVFLVNVAVAHVIKGDVDKAEEMLERLNFHPAMANKVLSVRLYLALSKGNVEKGRELALNHFNNSKTISLKC